VSSSAVKPNNASLDALHPDVRPDKYPLTGDICTIGRLPTCHIVVPQTDISRLHATIERRGSQYVLVDAGSANGTFINGRRIHEAHVLRNNDEIGLAQPEAFLRFNDHEATDPRPRKLQYIRREQRFIYKNIPLELSGNLTRLLLHLYEHLGEVCSRESCIQAIWNDQTIHKERYAQLHNEISELRDKFQAIDSKAEIIKNRRGMGYFLDINLS
jgi:DNA-binding response OmpR family regulator